MAVLMGIPAWAQQEGARMAARANVEPYDDEAAIMKSAYRDSPYFMEFTGRWDQKKTDSSVIYSREVEVEKFWKDYRVTLNVRCGRACRIMLGGKTVGYGGDSRHWNEFALNDFLKYGKKNVLAIETLNHSREAQLESADQMEGLNGEPYLLFKGDPNVDDLTVSADYDAALQSGTLSLDVSVFNSRKKGKYYIEVEVWDPKGHTLDRMGRWVVFDKSTTATVDLSRTWSNVEPWSAESPKLYTAVVRLRNEEMEEEEVVGARFGFRRVEVKDGVLQMNGTPLTIKGVTYGTKHTEGLASRERMKQDLLAMKKMNINAVRTAKYSPMDPYFYQLCDELGLYVVCDANLLPSSTQQHAVATDKDFMPLFERRVENLYGKYKNYPSIIAWSLGESRDNGICMSAAYKRLKYLDKTRPVIFAGADFSDNTDVIALMYPAEKTLHQSMEKNSDRPFLVLAAHEEDFGKIWDKVVNTRTLQGVFFADWPTSRMISELKNYYSPFDVRLSKKTIDDVEFLVYNRNDFADFSQYLLDYTIYTNRRPSITAGDLPLAIRGGGVEVAKLLVPPVDLQAGEELFIRFDLSRRQKAGSRQLSGDNNLGTIVFPLSDKSGKKTMLRVDSSYLHATSETLDGHERCRVQTSTNEVAFNLADGTMEWLTAGLGQFAFDSLSLCFGNHQDWNCSLAAISHNQPSTGVYSVDAMLRYHSRAGVLMCDVRQTYTVFSTGDVVIDYTIAPTDQLHETLVPQVRVKHTFGAADTFSWFGLDRETPYGVNNSAIPGTYRQPLSNGMIRDDNRWVALSDTAYKALFVDVPDTHFSFWTEKDILWVTPCISASPKPSFRLHLRGFTPNPYNISSTFVSEEEYHKQTRKGERPEDFVGVVYPRVSTGMLEPPAITATAARFSAPLTVTIASSQAAKPSGRSSAKQSDNQIIIRYTLDGSEPDENSPVYKDPITLSTTTVVKARAFGKGVPPSFIATRKFNYDYIVSTTFSRKPNTPFNEGTDTILFDGEKGTVDDLSQGWLGFSGNGIVATVSLSKPVDIDFVTLRFAHSPEMWAFAPKQVTLFLSHDGTSFADTLQVPVSIDAAAEDASEPRVVELRVPVGKNGVSLLKVDAQSIGAIPAWHRAKGLNPWLMMDEIEVSEATHSSEPNIH